MLTLEQASKLRDIEPFSKNAWEVIGDFPEINGVGLPGYFAQSVDIPLPKYSPEAVFGGAKNRYYAGTQDVDQITVNFFENHRTDVSRYVNNWLGYIRTQDGVYNLPVEYKKFFLIGMYDVSKKELVNVANVIDVWPVGGQQMSLDQTSGLLTLPISFSVDTVVFV